MSFLRPLRPGITQVHLADRVAAILRLVSSTTIEIWILADAPRLLATLEDSDPVRVAQRIAAGEFDNDFRFEVGEMNEDGEYLLVQIATPSQQEVYRSTMRDPYGFVGREREAQAEGAEYTLEERFDLYADRGW